jgi:hypothetical protein
MANQMEFLEWKGFESRRAELMSEEEFRDMQNTLIDNPAFGAVLPRTGGCRKMRVRRPGTGKSGGARVIYYCLGKRNEIHLLMLFPKGAKTTLTRGEESILKALTTKVKATKGSKGRL